MDNSNRLDNFRATYHSLANEVRSALNTQLGNTTAIRDLRAAVMRFMTMADQVVINIYSPTLLLTTVYLRILGFFHLMSMTPSNEAQTLWLHFWTLHASSSLIHQMSQGFR